MKKISMYIKTKFSELLPKKGFAHAGKRDKAFTLFVSLIVAALMLAIGFSIGNIIIKQLLLSSTGGGSQVGFYAADAASECALFWDRKNGDGFSVGDSPFSPVSTTTLESLNLVCGAGSTVDGGGVVYGMQKVCNTAACGEAMSQYATTTFYIDYRDSLDSKYLACAYVTIAKKYDSATGAEETTIDSRGYNTDLIIDPGSAGSYGYGGATESARCNLNRSRIVERGLLLTY